MLQKDTKLYILQKMKLKSIFHQTLPVWQTQTYFKHCTVQLVKQDLALQSFTLRTSAGF